MVTYVFHFKPWLQHIKTCVILLCWGYAGCRLLDVVSAQRTHHELHLMLIFEHVDQDLAQYLDKHSSGLSPECIQACINDSVSN